VAADQPTRHFLWERRKRRRRRMHRP
jgi:hypothetical protein